MYKVMSTILFMIRAQTVYDDVNYYQSMTVVICEI